MVATVLERLAKVFEAQGQYEVAVFHYKEAFQIYNQIKELRKVPGISHKVNILKIRSREFEEDLESLEYAEQFYSLIGNNPNELNKIRGIIERLKQELNSD